MYKQQHALERQQHGGDIGGISTTYGVHNGDQQSGYGHHQMQQQNYLRKIEKAHERANDDNNGGSSGNNINNPRIDRNAMNALRSIGQSEVKRVLIYACFSY